MKEHAHKSAENRRFSPDSARFRRFLLTILCILLAGSGAAQDTRSSVTTPGELRADSTFQCVSLEWDIAGDADHDAACAVRYRLKGLDAWRNALPLFRVDYAWWYAEKKAERPANLFAGSILFLEPGTLYEVKLDLTDPDSGNESRTFEVATRPIPTMPTDGRTLYVAPGSGDGTIGTPFRGLAMAQAAARPGRVEPQILSLKGGCNAVDAGIALPNINEDYAGASPDLGAVEFGKPLPHFGPRE